MVMFRFHKLLLAFCSLFLMSATASMAADMNIGFVDTARVLKQAPQAEQARKKLESEFAPRDKQVLEMRKKLKAMEDELIKDSSVMSELVRKKKEREIISQKRDIKRAREEFNEDLNIRRNEELNKLQKLVYEVIIALAKDENYDVILGDNVMFASKRVDVTDKVLERLRASYQPTATTSSSK
jgi:outer membrane protein